MQIHERRVGEGLRGSLASPHRWLANQEAQLHQILRDSRVLPSCLQALRTVSRNVARSQEDHLRSNFIVDSDVTRESCVCFFGLFMSSIVSGLRSWLTN